MARDATRGIVQKIKGKGASAVFIGSFLTKAAAFLGSIVLVRVVSKQDYGVLSYMENIYTYVYLFAGLGLNNAVFRYVVLKESSADKLGVISFVLSRGFAINIIIVALGFVASLLFPFSPEFARAAGLLPIMLLALPFQFSYDTFSYSLRALFRNRPYAVAAIAAIVLVWSGKVVGALLSGLDGAVWAGVLAYAMMALVLLAFFVFFVFSGVRSSKTLPGEGRSYFSYGLQFMVTNGLWSMFLQNDLLLIGLLTGDSLAVADYRVAYVVPSAISILSSSVGIFVSPYFIRHERDYAWVWRNYKRVIAGVCCMLGALCFLIAAVCEQFVQIFYGSEYLNVIPLMRLLLVSSFITNGVRYTTANLLSATGKVRSNMVVALVGIAAQIILDLILIPVLGVYGAALASILVYGGMAVAVVLVFVKEYRHKGEEPTAR